MQASASVFGPQRDWFLCPSLLALPERNHHDRQAWDTSSLEKNIARDGHCLCMRLTSITCYHFKKQRSALVPRRTHSSGPVGLLKEKNNIFLFNSVLNQCMLHPSTTMCVRMQLSNPIKSNFILRAQLKTTRVAKNYMTWHKWNCKLIPQFGKVKKA